MQMTPVIVPIDGNKKALDILNAVNSLMANPLTRNIIGYIKLNDALDISDLSGVQLIIGIKKLIKRHGSSAGIFFDAKLADTSDTNLNKLMHYQNAGVSPDILTVRESLSAKAMLVLRQALPNTKIALVSALTDTSVEECRRKHGMFPGIKIFNDATNVQAEYENIRSEDAPKKAFDMIVCSPLELDLLVKNFPCEYQFIVPGIRDYWMNSGQQSRFTGIREALNKGATYCVVGSQITKGNPNDNLMAKESQVLTVQEIEKANYTFISPENPIMTLHHCGGRYESPKNSDGLPIGPLVAYAGKDDNGKNKVGFVYFNFAKVEQNPIALNFYAALLAEKIKTKFFEESWELPDSVLGMANGGVKLAGALAYHLKCRDATAYKKTVKPANADAGEKEESILQIERHDIYPGDNVLIVEDVCNNFSTTKKAYALIKEHDADLVGIASAINRADEEYCNTDEDYWFSRPVISVCHIPSPQHTQDEPEIASLIADGKIVMEPKEKWGMLMEAMTKN